MADFKPASIGELVAALTSCYLDPEVTTEVPVYVVPEFGIAAPAPVSGVAIRWLAGSPELAVTPPVIVIEYRSGPAGRPVRPSSAQRCAWCAHPVPHYVPPGSGGGRWPLEVLTCRDCPGGQCKMGG